MTISPLIKTESLESLVAAHVDLVHAAALRQVGDAHLADDVTQTVFLLLARKMEQGALPARGGAYLGGWLLKVTRYTALTAMRGNRRRLLHEVEAGQAGEGLRESPAEHDVLLSALLDEALMGLGEADRELIVLRYMRGYTVPQAAAALRLRTNTAAKRIERALEKLRRFFRRRGVETSSAGLGAWLPLGAIGPAPATILARILTAAATVSPLPSSGMPLGVVLMTISTKLKVAVVAAILVMLMVGTYVVVRTSRPPEKLMPPALVTAPPLPAAPPDVELTTTTLKGTVTDAAGKPLAGILVTQGATPYLVDGGYLRTITDDNGRFELAGVRIREDLVLTAQGNGYSPELVTGVVTRETGSIAIKLQPGRTLRVRVLDPRGKPLPNFALDPMFWRKTEVLRIYDLPTWAGPMTDAEGLLTWKDAPADEVTFQPILTETYLAKRFTLSASDQIQTIVVPDPIKVAIAADDADSHLPIRAFKVTYGYGDRDNQPDYWNEDEAFPVSSGDYRTAISTSSRYHYFRVDAPGYAPAIQNFTEKDPEVSLSFHLSKKRGIELKIVRPDGTPANNAPIYVISSKQNFELASTKLFLDQRMPFDAGQMVLTANVEGKVLVPATDDVATRVIVVDETGYADVRLADAADRGLRLRAWGRVEGTAFVGSKPLSKETISLQLMGDANKMPYVGGELYADSDEAGHFVFERVPPANVIVGRVISTGGGQFANGGLTNTTPELVVQPGKTMTVTVGGTGRPVIGRIVAADGGAIANAVYALGMIRSQREQTPKPPLPPEVAKRIAEITKLPLEQQQAEFEKLQGMPEVIAINAAWEAKQTTMKSYSFVVGADGVFRSEDIVAGNYVVWVQVFSATTKKPLGQVNAAFTVPGMTGGRMNEALDLGALKLLPEAGRGR